MGDPVDRCLQSDADADDAAHVREADEAVRDRPRGGAIDSYLDRATRVIDAARRQPEPSRDPPRATGS